MDHLRGYESSSSSSHCSTKSAITDQLGNKSDVNVVHTRHEQGINANALAQDPPDYSISVGNSGHREESSFDTNGETNSFNKRGGGRLDSNLERMTTRQKVMDESIPRVTIAGENHNDGADCLVFERTDPHWEGRWAGHIFLPFPPLHRLDAPNEREEPGNEATTTSCPDEGDDYSDDGQISDVSGEEEDATLQESQAFLPAVRVLVNCWAFILQNLSESEQLLSDQSSSYEPTITIVPHVPMKYDWTKGDYYTSNSSTPCRQNSKCIDTSLSLHASLSRPIYLPAPSVDSFLSSIQKCITTVITAVKSNTITNSNSKGRVFHLEPHAATIFTNDQQNRSFLTIPITGQNATWIKRAILPPIDATMKKFGLQSYYNEEGCILHVSVASVKGNMVKRMSPAKYHNYGVQADINARSIRLLPCMQHISATTQSSEIQAALQSIPRLVPVRLDRVRCQFGKVKDISIKF